MGEASPAPETSFRGKSFPLLEYSVSFFFSDYPNLVEIRKGSLTGKSPQLFFYTQFFLYHNRVTADAALICKSPALFSQ